MGKKESLFLEKIRLEIQGEKTGTPHELAEKIGLSRRMTYYYINRLKKNGENIAYSRKKQTFLYVKST